MSQLNVALALTGAVVILIGLFSKPIKASPVQGPMIAMSAGIVAGPYGLGWLDIARWGEEHAILEQASRLTLAIGLMGVALRIRRASLAVLWRPVTLLLVVGMLGMWLAGSALSWAVLGLPVWMALLVGAAVTPTDPVVASSIVTGDFAEKHLPQRLRDGISLESGANDGLAYLFVMLPVLMYKHPPGMAWEHWLRDGLLVGVVLAVAIGVAVGYAAAKLLSLAERLQSVEGSFLLGYTVAFALATLGAAHLVKADAIISVFLAGLVFNVLTPRREEHEEEHIQEAVSKLFTMPMFVLLGLALPFTEWARLGWPLAAFAVLVLLLRRPPVVALIGPGMRRWFTLVDLAYLGWFGPIGVAAIYYAAFAWAETGQAVIWHIASAAIFASILGHGVTAAALTRRYARYDQVPPPGARELQARQG